MENSCRKKYKPFPKKWILASRHSEFRRNSALIPANAGLFHYAGNNPIRYIDPTGAFDWNTNTIEDGDTLSQIAEDCYTKYGVNYTTDDLKDLNKDTISDKDKIYAGTHLNLGKVEEVQRRAADYQSRATTKYSNAQVMPGTLKSADVSENGKSRGVVFSVTDMIWMTELCIGNLGTYSFCLGKMSSSTKAFREFSFVCSDLSAQMGYASVFIDYYQLKTDPSFKNLRNLGISTIGIYNSWAGLFLQYYANYQDSVNEYFNQSYSTD